MKRFDYNDDDFQDENFFSNAEGDGEGNEMSDKEYAEMMKRQDAMQYIQLGLFQKELDQKLLARVIKMLEKSWFWNFRRQQTKLRMVAETYLCMKELLDIKNEE